MSTFQERRRFHLLCLGLFAALVLYAAWYAKGALLRQAVASGWCLLGAVLVLASYNLRKKLAFLPLGSSAGWLQLHIYLGLLSLLIFGVHISWRTPNGIFEILLAGAYLAVAISGLFGLFITRLFPRRLTNRGHEEIFERIPRRFYVLQNQTEALVFDCLAATDSTAIPEMYAKRLRAFFGGPRNFWHHLISSDRPLNRLIHWVESQSAYVNDQERTVLGKLQQAIREKDHLDYHYAHQALLKYWLFFHIPMTYGLLLFAAFHVLLVYAYSGGLR